MKTLIISALCLGFCTVVASAQQTTIKTHVDSISYSIGWDVGNSIKTQSITVTPALVARGIVDALEAKKEMLTQEQMQQILMALRQEMMAKQQAHMEQAGAQNKQAGEAFMTQNKSRKGVTTLPSGLQYEVVKEGTGATPTATSQVTVHYTGALTDGTVFDSSVERGEPASFQVNGVIPGWTEALQLMKTGAKWKLYIPSDLAYGAQGIPGTIPPNSVLVFDVELLGVQ